MSEELSQREVWSQACQEAKPLTVDRLFIRAWMEYGQKRWQAESWDTPEKSVIDYMVEEVEKHIRTILPPESERIRELAEQFQRLKAENYTEEQNYLFTISQLESKIARAIEYGNGLLPYSVIAEQFIKILEAKL